MSDSDDTDVLLLIPPDFFLADTASSSEDVAIEANTLTEVISPCRRNSRRKIDFGNHQTDHCPINHQLSIEKTPLTISQQQSRETSFDRPTAQMYHSTPKADRFTPTDYGKRKEDFIREIDNHLQNTNGIPTNGDVKRLAVETIKKHNSLLENRRTDYQDSDRNFGYVSGGAEAYSKFGRLSDWRNDVNRSSEMKKSLGVNDTLLSLNEIWDASGKTESATVHEERTRREVCTGFYNSLSEIRHFQHTSVVVLALRENNSNFAIQINGISTENCCCHQSG